MAERRGRGDPIEPRPEPRVAAKRVAVDVREQHRVLCDVLRRFGGSDDPARDRVDELALRGAEPGQRIAADFSSKSFISVTITAKTFFGISVRPFT